MSDLVIFGTGGFAREVLQIVQDLNAVAPSINLLGFLDGNPDRHGLEVHGYPVLGGSEWLAANPGVKVVVAIGNSAVRRRVTRQIEDLTTAGFMTLVHPRAWVGRQVYIGTGTIICAGCMITTDIAIGNHVILNLSCTVGHDAVLADFVTLLPSVNVSGAVRLAEGADIGTGTQILPGVAVGEWSIVGAGAVVVKEIPANVTAVGAPAKPIKERNPGWHEA